MVWDSDLAATYRSGATRGAGVIEDIRKRKEEEKKQKLDAFLKLADAANLDMEHRMAGIKSIQERGYLDESLMTKPSETETELKYVPGNEEQAFRGGVSPSGQVVGETFIKPPEESFVPVPKREPVTAVPKLSKDVVIDNFIVAAYPHLKEFLGQTIPRDKFTEATKSYRAETVAEGQAGRQGVGIKASEESQSRLFEQQKQIQDLIAEREQERITRQEKKEFRNDMLKIVDNKEGEFTDAAVKEAANAVRILDNTDEIPTLGEREKTIFGKSLPGKWFGTQTIYVPKKGDTMTYEGYEYKYDDRDKQYHRVGKVKK